MSGVHRSVGESVSWCVMYISAYISALCNDCHAIMDGRDWAEQLAILRRSRPHEYNLLAFHTLARRCKPSDGEVSLWSLRFSFVSSLDAWNERADSQ